MRTQRTGLRGFFARDSSCGRTTSGNLLYKLKIGSGIHDEVLVVVVVDIVDFYECTDGARLL